MVRMKLKPLRGADAYVRVDDDSFPTITMRAVRHHSTGHDGNSVGALLDLSYSVEYRPTWSPGQRCSPILVFLESVGTSVPGYVVVVGVVLFRG